MAERKKTYHREQFTYARLYREDLEKIVELMVPLSSAQGRASPLGWTELH